MKGHVERYIYKTNMKNYRKIYGDVYKKLFGVIIIRKNIQKNILNV